MTMVLDRYFVHRIRRVTGKDGNPLNEVELLTESLLTGDGTLRGNNVIKFVPDESVLKLDIGDRIKLTAAQFERLAKAFLAEDRIQVPPEEGLGPHPASSPSRSARRCADAASPTASAAARSTTAAT